MDILDKKIILNVGGTNFETYKSTLIKAPYFEAMLSGKYRDDKEDIFIDRDPDLFKHVLRYLRDASYDVPFNIYSELLFYGIEKNEPINETEKIEKDILLTPEHYDEIFKAGANPLIAIVATGLQNEPMTHHTPFHQPHKIIKPLLCAHGKFIQEIENNTFKIRRCADLLFNLSLQFKIQIPENMAPSDIAKIRYQLFDAVDLFWDHNCNFRITKHLLEAWEQLFLPPQQRHLIAKLDATGEIIIKLPYWFTDNPGLSLSLLGHFQPQLKIKELNREIPVPNLIMEQVYLDNDERKEAFGPQQYPVKQWQFEERVINNGKTFDIPLLFNHVCDLFIITVKKDKQTIPINTIKMYLNDKLFIDTTGNMQLLEMADNNMFPSEHIYALSMKHGSVNLSRIDTTIIRIELKEMVDNAQVHIFGRNNNILKISPVGVGLAYMN